MSRAGRLGLGASLIMGLLPACQPERLIVVKVDLDENLKNDPSVSVSIALLEGRKGPDYQPTPPLDFTDHDGGTTIFPALLGIYLKERSGPLSVKVFAYAKAGDPAVAVGRRDMLMLNDERTQFFAATEEVLLHSCKDNSLCGNSPPDGGDGGGDADTGTDAAPFDAGPIPQACTDYCTGTLALCSTLYLDQRQCEVSCVAARLGSDELTCLIGRIGFPPYPAKCRDLSLAGRSCSDGCTTYCALGLSICSDQLFADQACIDKCQALPAGNAESPRGDDSVLCRVSWLEDSINNPALCAHALPAGPCQAQ